MIGLLGGVLERGADVARLELRMVREDPLAADTRRQQVEDVLHPNANPTNARPAAALSRTDRNAVQLAHRDLQGPSIGAASEAGQAAC